MLAGRGKAKGGAFEREVARKLSLWLSHGRRSDLLWRSSMSGGLATIEMNRDKVNLTQSGDLSAIGEEAYDFCQKTFVECKHVQNLNFGRGFICETGELSNFWKICFRESLRYQKRPMLIARQNRFPTVVLTSSYDTVFPESPLIVLNNWKVDVRLFDDAVRVRRPMIRRAK